MPHSMLLPYLHYTCNDTTVIRPAVDATTVIIDNTRMKKNEDPYLGLLAYRSTPLENGYSPMELLIGRKLRTTVPVIGCKLVPKLPDRIALRTKEEWIKDRQKRNFDTRHRARSLSPLQTGDAVWVADNEKSGTVVEESAPCSYLVATPDGTYRRNRRHLISTTPQSLLH